MAELIKSSSMFVSISFGTGEPSLVAAQGSLYLRTDGTGTADRVYVNTDGAMGWTNLVAAS